MKPPLKERSPFLRFLRHAHQNGLKEAMLYEASMSRRSWAYVLGVIKGWCGGLLRWFFSWRIQRRLWIAVASFATLVALLYAVANWRGQQAWERYRQVAEAGGQSFNYEDYVPKAVPDDQNLAMAPFFRPLLQYRLDPALAWEDPQAYVRSTGVSPYWRKAGYQARPSLGRWLKSETCDLHEWQFYYRGPTNLPPGSFPEAWPQKYASVKREQAEGIHDTLKFTIAFPIAAQPQTPAADVLLALSLFDAELAEIAEAAQRSLGRWPVRYEDGFGALLPHLSVLQMSSETLWLRAIAQLHAGNPDLAVEDLLHSWTLVESLRSEPFSISAFVRQAMVRESLQVVWEGQKLHKWNQAQLNRIASRLSQFEFAKQQELGRRMDRAGAYGMFLGLWSPPAHYPWRAYRDVMRSPQWSGLDLMLDWWLRLAPKGWRYRNMIAWDQAIQSSTTPNYFYGSTDKEAVKMSDLLPKNAILIPAAVLGGYIQRVPQTETESPNLRLIQLSVQLAHTACALDQHRLRNGEYPESLDALIPEFLTKLPVDSFADRPLRYRRTASDGFTLWSIGPNRVEDEGMFGESVSEGDLVWRISRD